MPKSGDFDPLAHCTCYFGDRFRNFAELYGPEVNWENFHIFRQCRQNVSLFAPTVENFQKIPYFSVADADVVERRREVHARARDRLPSSPQECLRFIF